MTNLAYKAPLTREQRQGNVTYVDFAAHAARRNARQRRQALCQQHRYGLALLVVCVLTLAVGIGGAVADMTALLVLVPLAVFLLSTKQVVLYKPGMHRR